MTYFNILLVVEDSVLLLAASQTSKILHLFDYQIYNLESIQLELSANPLKIVSLGEKVVLILYKDLKESSILITGYNRVAVLQPRTILSGMNLGGRHMDVAVLNDPLDNKYAPLIAILYDENKIDVLRGNDYNLVQNLLVDDWNYAATDNQGFIVLLPYSDFLVTAK